MLAPLIPALTREKQVDLSEPETNLAFILSSNPVRAT